MRILFAAALALALSACATLGNLGAANDVHALLISIRDNDKATFDQLVDRRALTSEISDRLVAEAVKDPRIPPALAAVLAPGLTKLAGDVLIQPDVLRTVAEEYGYTRDTKIPSAVAISQRLTKLPDGRVCATRQKDGPCVLTFTKAEGGRWRLSGYEGELSKLRLPR